MKYADQIKSPKWQKKRLEILKRDEFTCQECGNTELQLHVHHKHYNKGAEIWNYKGWELTTLCENCHFEKHNLEKKQEDKKSDEYYSILSQIKNLDFETLFSIDIILSSLLFNEYGKSVMYKISKCLINNKEQQIEMFLNNILDTVIFEDRISRIELILSDNKMSTNDPF